MYLPGQWEAAPLRGATACCDVLVRTRTAVLRESFALDIFAPSVGTSKGNAHDNSRSYCTLQRVTAAKAAWQCLTPVPSLAPGGCSSLPDERIQTLFSFPKAIPISGVVVAFVVKRFVLGHAISQRR